MNNKKFVFIVLHYMNQSVTDFCIQRLLGLHNQSEIYIIVLDNGSSNGSGKEIEREWKELDNVEVILLDKNIGFSAGNNVAYNYAKQKVSFDYVVFLNNDILIKDIYFCDKVEQIYRRTGFAVLGPDVYQTKRGLHQNPESIIIKTKSDVLNVLEKERKNRKYWIYYAIKYEVKRIFQELMMNGNLRIEIDREKKQEFMTLDKGMKLHGSCLIFSVDYFGLEKMIFMPETFLYCEEDILALQCIRKNKKMYYSSEIVVEHLGSCSSQLFSLRGRKKFFERRIEALEILKMYMEKAIDG